jgi:hypothetical protein
MLDGFIEIGYVTDAIPAGGVVEGSAQHKGELSATMAMLGHGPPGCHLQKSESTAARHRELMVPYAEPEPAPSHGIEAVGQEARKRRAPPDWHCACAMSLLQWGGLRGGGLCALQQLGRERSEQRRADALEPRHFAATARAHEDVSRRHRRE